MKRTITAEPETSGEKIITEISDKPDVSDNINTETIGQEVYTKSDVQTEMVNTYSYVPYIIIPIVIGTFSACYTYYRCNWQNFRLG